MTSPLRILISADMEGVSGVVHPAETQPGRYDYERGRALMTADMNAVVEGVMDAAEGAEVLVADAHGTFRNLLPEDLDERVQLIRGRPRQLGMMAGLECATDVAMFVGYHGRAGTGPGVLAHTMSDAVLDVRLNGRAMGEIGLNAFLAGYHRVPVAFLSGDDTACRELNELVPEATTVAVKRAIGQASAEIVHPVRAREQLRTQAAQAVRRRDQVQPLQASTPVDIEIDLYRPHIVDLATLVPGVRRAEGARTVAFTARDMAEAYGLVRLMVELGQIEAN